MYQKSPDQLSGKGNNSGEIAKDLRPIFFAGGNTHTNVHPRRDLGRAAINISMKPKGLGNYAQAKNDVRTEESFQSSKAILIGRRERQKGSVSVMMKIMVNGAGRRWRLGMCRKLLNLVFS